MNKIKIFKTTNREFLKNELIINDWIEREGIEIVQISVNSGADYSISSFPRSYSTEVEIFITVLYKE